MSERTQCPGCVGRGAGTRCCMCGLTIPEVLRREPGDPSEFPGVTVEGWPFAVETAREANR